jgi:phosphopentomutase
MGKKEKLTTEIEKQLHKHMQTIKESSVDFTVLYIRRNNIDVDRDSLAKICEVFRKAIDSEHLNHVDRFLTGLDKALTAVTEED